MSEYHLMCTDQMAMLSPAVEKNQFTAVATVHNLHVYADLGAQKKHTHVKTFLFAVWSNCMNSIDAHRVFFFLETMSPKKGSKTQNNKFNLVSKFTVDASAAVDYLQIALHYITCTAMHAIMVQ